MSAAVPAINAACGPAGAGESCQCQWAAVAAGMAAEELLECLQLSLCEELEQQGQKARRTPFPPPVQQQRALVPVHLEPDSHTKRIHPRTGGQDSERA